MGRGARACGRARRRGHGPVRRLGARAGQAGAGRGEDVPQGEGAAREHAHDAGRGRADGGEQGAGHDPRLLAAGQDEADDDRRHRVRDEHRRARQEVADRARPGAVDATGVDAPERSYAVGGVGGHPGPARAVDGRPGRHGRQAVHGVRADLERDEEHRRPDGRDPAADERERGAGEQAVATRTPVPETR